MAATDSITLIKSFSYRGAAEEFSNTYHMDGTTPASSASWKTLADNIIAAEKAIYPSTVSIVRGMGHKAGVKTAQWFYDYAAHSASVPGTAGTPAASVPMAGDAAVWIKWSTTQFTSRGKPIYLRSYYHRLWQGNTDTTCDTNPASHKTVMETYGAAWITGFLDGASVSHHRAGPNGAIGLAATASTYITTRTLERRGKRP